eukprot:TRINITY_DN4001_c0_g1_i1.p2 TRINITY_DN4001_c0_g1~~TRINITY_DN4001_c0_g1_i1.p2  ORF type:complete len:166 (-),score=53.39 TRINITY_DN4001_c0_g1_i1:1205-1675(-)
MQQLQVKPVSEFFDTKRFSVPHTADEAISRLQANLRNFAVNYLLVFACFIVVSCFRNHYMLVPVLGTAGVAAVLFKVRPQQLEDLLKTDLNKAFVLSFTLVSLIYLTSTFGTLTWCFIFAAIVSMVHAAMLAPQQGFNVGSSNAHVTFVESPTHEN